ncbi:hypothetical protein [Terrarubrum flagellatum]|uniref:hypothetical protein n=1 Tax=Terrirubrum flagellatum TaxID=2895980 RepID=UPI00314545A9
MNVGFQVREADTLAQSRHPPAKRAEVGQAHLATAGVVLLVTRYSAPDIATQLLLLAALAPGPAALKGRRGDWDHFTSLKAPGLAADAAAALRPDMGRSVIRAAISFAAVCVLRWSWNEADAWSDQRRLQVARSLRSLHNGFSGDKDA